MQVSVENTSTLGRRVIIQIPAATVEQSEQNKMHSMVQKLRLPGFRPGKVPLKLAQQKFGKQVRMEAINELLEKSLPTALDENKLVPVARPEVEDIHDSAGEDVKLTVSFEVFPEIEIKEFSEIKLDKPTAEITDADVDKGIERLQEQFAEWAEYAGPAKINDKVKVNFVGTIDGKPFDNGSAEDVEIELGSNTFIPGFEEGLVGSKAGDKKTLDLTFPEDYGHSDLAGKAAKFEVEISLLQEKKLAPVDEAFAVKLGLSKEDGVEKIREKIRTNLADFLDEFVNKDLREKVLEQLGDLHQFEVPETLMRQEKRNLVEDMQRRQQASNTDGAELPEEAELDKMAKQRITMGMLLDKIIKKHEIKVDEKRVRKKISETAGMLGNAEMIESLYYKSKELISGVRSTVLTEQAADLIISHATITEKPSSFYEIVNGSPEKDES